MLQIGRNIFSLVFSRIIAGIILFLIFARLAQYLGPELAGQYGLLTGFLAVFSIFVDLGMSQLVIKKVSEDKTQAGKYLSNYFIIQFLLGVIFMTIMAGFVYFSNYPDIVKNSLYVTSFGLLLTSLALPFRSIINSYQKLTYIARVNFANSVINGVFMVLAIIFRQSIFFLAFISVAVGLFDFLVYWYVSHTKFTKFKFEFDKQFAKKLIIWTMPFTLLTAFSIYNRVDTLMLPSLRSFQETGYYAAAYKFWDVLAFFPAVIGISLYPFYAESLAKNLKEQVSKMLETYTRYMIAIGVPMAIGTFLVATPLILIFFGEDFLPAASALWLLVLAVSILFIYSPANSLVISQQTKAATKITGFTLLFNVVTNLIFIPKFGIAAAAATTVASEVIQAVSYSYIIKTRIVPFRFFRHFIKPLISGAIMAAAILVLKPVVSIWIVIGVGAVAYILAMLLLKFFHREDWELMKAAIDVRKKVDTGGGV
ncbi:MAG: flippase [bacterium]|nr:flippase [bacterium]